MPTVLDSSGFIPAYVVLIIAASAVWASYSPVNTWPQLWLSRVGYATGYGLYNTIDQVSDQLCPLSLKLGTLHMQYAEAGSSA